MTRKNNLVIKASLRRRLCRSRRISESRFNNLVSELVKYDFMMRIEPKVYMVNPWLVSKSDERNANVLRTWYKGTRCLEIINKYKVDRYIWSQSLADELEGSEDIDESGDFGGK